MKVRLFSVCDSAVIDMPTNRLSIFNIQEEFSAPIYPCVLPKIVLVTVLEKENAQEPDDLSVEVTILINDQELGTMLMPNNFQGKMRTRTIGEMQGLVLPNPGKLTFSLKSQNKNIGKWEIETKKIGEVELDSISVPGVISHGEISFGTNKPAKPASKKSTKKS